MVSLLIVSIRDNSGKEELFINIQFEANDLMGVYSEIAELIGVEQTRRIYERLKGQQVTFPQKFISSDALFRIVQEEYNGNNAKQLARELNYTERYIRKIVQNK